MNQSNDGFTEIKYKGKAVAPDKSASSESFVVANNWLHRLWLIYVRRWPKNKVVRERWLDMRTVSEEFKTPTGRVTKVTGVPTYEPDHKVKGGRVVKGMPKSLKKLKEAQDKAPSEM